MVPDELVAVQLSESPLLDQLALQVLLLIDLFSQLNL